MYEVSNAYKTAMAQPVHRFKLAGYVGTVGFTESNILAGSLSITNKFSDGDDFKIGSVVTGALSCTFLRGIAVSEGDVITLEEGLHIGGGVYEYVPLGVYIVKESNRTAAGTVVKAYDHMALLDRSFNYDTTIGEPYDIALQACNECSVVLGMTREQMQSLPNGTRDVTLYMENDIETWRDVIFWIAQLMCSFATIDRQGRLVFRSFSGSSVDTINSRRRIQGASFSNFVTRYSGISYVDIISGETKYYGLPEDRYLTYNLGQNPFLQYGSDSEKENRVLDILDALSAIEFTPFKAKTSVGSAFDLGDVITQYEGLGAGSTVCIMRYVWKYGKGYEMEGVGKNPALASARSKMDKNIAGLLSQQKEDKIQFYSFFNAKAIHIADGETKPVIEIQFTANKQTTVVFHAEILMDVDTTVNGHEYNALTLNVLYLYDDVDMEHYKPKETWFDGNHILHLLYYFDINEFTLHNLKVLLNTDGASIDIGPGEIRASVWGQNLAAVDHWDGTITVREETGVADLIMPTLITGIGIGAESVSTHFITPDETTVTQIAGLTTLIMPPSLTTMNPTETISVSLEEVNT
jgi:hypothetical protein